MANISGGTSAALADVGSSSKGIYAEIVDPSGNKIPLHKAAVLTNQYTFPQAGLDDDTIRLTRLNRLGNAMTDSGVLHFWDGSEGASLNTQKWTSTATTLTSSQTASTGILLNAGAVTTINSGIVLTSQKGFAKFPRQPLWFSGRMRSTAVANQVWELGIAQMGTLSGTTAQIDNGAVWRWTSGGTIVPVLIANGSDVSTGSDVAASINTANYYTYDVILEDDHAMFTVQRSDTGAIISEQELRLPLASPKAGAVTHYNTWYRLRNTGSLPASAGQTFLAECQVAALDLAEMKPWTHQAAALKLGQELSPTAFTQTAQFANSAWPTTATLSNTAASYSTLGGLWTLNAAASATTDNSFFSFAVPSPYSFYCTGAHITMMNTGAANAATPASTLFWGLGTNGASANLSTGGHLRKALGVTSIPASAAIGAASPDVDINFDVPLVTGPGKHITVIMRIVGGAATASQVWQGSVTLRGYFE